MSEEKTKTNEEIIEMAKYKAEEIIFKELKAVYKQKRKHELVKLKEFFQKHFSSKGFDVEVRLFSRDTPYKKQYKSKGDGSNSKVLEIAPYDNTNWLGLDVILSDNTGARYAFFISLQAFDYDSGSGNYHVLMDRVGVYMYHEDIVKKYNEIEDKDKAKGVLKPGNALAEMYTTDFDLPLSKEDLKGLAELLEKFISNDLNLLEKRIERIKVRRDAANKSTEKSDEIIDHLSKLKKEQQK